MSFVNVDFGVYINTDHVSSVEERTDIGIHKFTVTMSNGDMYDTDYIAVEQIIGDAFNSIYVSEDG